MKTPSTNDDNSLRNFPPDLLAVLGFPVAAIAMMASWVLSIHGVAWIWAAGISLGVAILGGILLFMTKSPSYRQGRFFTFGIQALPPASHGLYL